MLYAINSSTRIRLCGVRLHKFNYSLLPFSLSDPARDKIFREDVVTHNYYLNCQMPEKVKGTINVQNIQLRRSEYQITTISLIHPMVFWAPVFHQYETKKISTFTPVSKSLVHPFSPIVVWGIKAIESWSFFRLYNIASVNSTTEEQNSFNNKITCNLITPSEWIVFQANNSKNSLFKGKNYVHGGPYPTLRLDIN